MWVDIKSVELASSFPRS